MPSLQDSGWLLPDWDIPGVRAVCTTRSGGISAPPYDSLNLGLHVRDDPQAVLHNRARVANALQARPVWLNQVHGTRVVQLQHAIEDGLTADGVCTTERGLACTIMVADCLPVLLSDTRGRVVGAAHAGWRGLAGMGGMGILDQTVGAMRDRLRSLDPQGAQAPLVAWLGPCIGPSAFEVGSEVIQAFRDNGFREEGLWSPRPGREGKWQADLAGLARQRLRDLGLRDVRGNDGSPDWCTVSDSTRWFSHRRDRVSGRLAAGIWRV